MEHSKYARHLACCRSTYLELIDKEGSEEFLFGEDNIRGYIFYFELMEYDKKLGKVNPKFGCDISNLRPGDE